MFTNEVKPDDGVLSDVWAHQGDVLTLFPPEGELQGNFVGDRNLVPEADFKITPSGRSDKVAGWRFSLAGFTIVTMEPVSIRTKASAPSIWMRQVQVRIPVDADSVSVAATVIQVAAPAVGVSEPRPLVRYVCMAPAVGPLESPWSRSWTMCRPATCSA